MTSTSFLRFTLLLFFLGFQYLTMAQSCSNAIVNDIYTSPITTYTIAGNDAANNSASCSLDGDDAVWITINIPANALATQMTITMDDWGGCSGFACRTDVTLAMYSGACGSLTTIDDCIDLSGGAFNSNNGPWNFPITPGTDYFFRLSEEDDQGGFVDFLFELNSYALPVELASFVGKATKDGNKIEWTTSMEEDLEWFILEKSMDSQSWREQERISAVGDSDVLQSYSVTDKTDDPLSYYRLKSLDYDGSASISEIISVKRRAQNNPISQVYPNPSQGVFTLKLAEEIDFTSDLPFFVTNTLGAVVRQGQILKGGLDNERYELDLSFLPKGMYFLAIRDAQGTVFTEKLYIEVLAP